MNRLPHDVKAKESSLFASAIENDDGDAGRDARR